MVQEETFRALKKAEEAFYESLSREGYDGGYWDIEFTAYELGSDFVRLQRITVEREVERKGKSKG